MNEATEALLNSALFYAAHGIREAEQARRQMPPVGPIVTGIARSVDRLTNLLLLIGEPVDPLARTHWASPRAMNAAIGSMTDAELQVLVVGVAPRELSGFQMRVAATFAEEALVDLAGAIQAALTTDDVPESAIRTLNTAAAIQLRLYAKLTGMEFAVADRRGLILNTMRFLGMSEAQRSALFARWRRAGWLWSVGTVFEVTT